MKKMIKNMLGKAGEERTIIRAFRALFSVTAIITLLGALIAPHTIILSLLCVLMVWACDAELENK